MEAQEVSIKTEPFELVSDSSVFSELNNSLVSSSFLTGPSASVEVPSSIMPLREIKMDQIVGVDYSIHTSSVSVPDSFLQSAHGENDIYLPMICPTSSADVKLEPVSVAYEQDPAAATTLTPAGLAAGAAYTSEDLAVATTFAVQDLPTVTTHTSEDQAVSASPWTYTAEDHVTSATVSTYTAEYLATVTTVYGSEDVALTASHTPEGLTRATALGYHDLGTAITSTTNTAQTEDGSSKELPLVPFKSEDTSAVPTGLYKNVYIKSEPSVSADGSAVTDPAPESAVSVAGLSSELGAVRANRWQPMSRTARTSRRHLTTTASIASQGSSTKIIRKCCVSLTRLPDGLLSHGSLRIPKVREPESEVQRVDISCMKQEPEDLNMLDWKAYEKRQTSGDFSKKIPKKRSKLGPRPYKCNLCGKTYKTASGCSQHKKVHLGKKEHKCKVCGKMFIYKSSMTSHLRIHADIRPYPCHICGKAFRWSSHLNMHIGRHTTERPHVCSQCGKAFKQMDGLKAHIKCHTELRPFECQHCSQTFRTNCALKSHLRRHTGEKPYKCHLCPAVFTHSTTLTFHIRAHTGERPYKCKLCPSTFTQSSHLKTHMIVHRDPKKEQRRKRKQQREEALLAQGIKPYRRPPKYAQVLKPSQSNSIPTKSSRAEKDGQTSSNQSVPEQSPFLSKKNIKQPHKKKLQSPQTRDTSVLSAPSVTPAMLQSHDAPASQKRDAMQPEKKDLSQTSEKVQNPSSVKLQQTSKLETTLPSSKMSKSSVVPTEKAKAGPASKMSTSEAVPEFLESLPMRVLMYRPLLFSAVQQKLGRSDATKRANKASKFKKTSNTKKKS